MSMSLQERLSVNNPVRDWFMRGEMAAFRRLADLPAGATVLDMGCGRGTSVRLILPDVPSRRGWWPSTSTRRPSNRPAAGWRRCWASRSSCGWPTLPACPSPTREFDAALELGILHHIPDWRAALRETARVLKPGGVFYFAEPSYGRIHRGMYCLLGHPKDAGFTADELRRALSDAGLQPDERFHRTPLWDLVGSPGGRAGSGMGDERRRLSF